jgi:hypothetical protein
LFGIDEIKARILADILSNSAGKKISDCFCLIPMNIVFILLMSSSLYFTSTKSYIFLFNSSIDILCSLNSFMSNRRESKLNTFSASKFSCFNCSWVWLLLSPCERFLIVFYTVVNSWFASDLIFSSFLSIVTSVPCCLINLRMSLHTGRCGQFSMKTELLSNSSSSFT